MEIRPRSTGEVLDDAWRLALADAPLLLLFSTLFLIPAFTVVLLLLAQPAPSGLGQCVLPALAALLLPLTGLASGACQELFRRRAADEPAAASDCLAATLRHGLEHAAARAVLLCGSLLGLLVFLCGVQSSASPALKLLGFLFGPLLMLVLSFPLWVGGTALPVLITTGAMRSGTLWRELRRDAAFAPGKAAAITLSRLPLLLLAALELHLLASVLLWIGDNLGGFDTALLGVELTFLGNPVYTTALFLLSWLLLAPFFEASNFLLHTDVRTRQEGLDLQYRVQRVFTGLVRPDAETIPTGGRGRRVGALLLLAGLLLTGRPARADEARLQAVRLVRQGIETIRDEVKKAAPYPGGQRWVGRLRSLGTRLARADDGDARRCRWYDRAIADFGDRKQEDALLVLDDLHRRLALLEDALAAPRHDPRERSPDDIKSLLRGTPGRKRERSRPREKVEEDQQEPEAQGAAPRGCEGRRPAPRGRRRTARECPPLGAAAVYRFWAGCCWAAWDWRSWLWRWCCSWRRRAVRVRRSRRPQPASSWPRRATPGKCWRNRPRNCGVRPRGWPAKDGSATPCASSISPCCRCCTGSSSFVSSRPAPTANTCGRSVCPSSAGRAARSLPRTDRPVRGEVVRRAPLRVRRLWRLPHAGGGDTTISP